MGELNSTSHSRIRFFAGREIFGSEAREIFLSFFTQILGAWQE